MANPAIYSTVTQFGVDINNVFVLDAGSSTARGTAMEYPAPPFLPGELAWGTDGSEWVYCKSSIAIGVGKVCIISEVPGSWSVALIGGATIASASVPYGDLVGVCSGSTGTLTVPAPTGTQSASYFWLQRAGNCQALDCAASCTKDLPLYSSATVGGRVTVTAGGIGTTYAINGIVVSQATGSVAGPNTCILNYPTVGLAT